MGIAALLDSLWPPGGAPPASTVVTPSTPVPPPNVTADDQANLLGRINALLPNRWFPVGASPIKDAVLSGAANALAAIYEMLVYLRLQTRISTATDGFLDLIAWDFFAGTLTRLVNQSDASFRNNILINLLQPRGTRASVSSILQRLTGRIPLIVEPQRAADCGGYGIAYGYGSGGAYGSLLLPYQSFVIAYRTVIFGAPNVAGYGVPTGAYSTPSRAAYIDLALAQQGVTDSQIIASVESVRPAGYTIWLNLSD